MKIHDDIIFSCKHKDMKNLKYYFLENDIRWCFEANFTEKNEKRFDYWLDPKNFEDCVDGFNFYLENNIITGWDYYQNISRNFKIIPFEKILRERKLKRVLQ